MDSGTKPPGGGPEAGASGAAARPDADDPAGVDRALARAARDGDTGAFERLVERHRNRVFWVARQVVGDAEEAKDVTQNVLVRLWRTLPRYDEQYAFSTWLYRMTVNLSIDSLRRGASRRHDTVLEESLVDVERASGAPARPDQGAQAAEVQRIFDELKDLLPPQQRAAFVLREMEGLTSEEVAEVLDLSPSTVRNHLFQARRTLQAAMEKRYPEYLPRASGARGKPTGGGSR